MVYVMRKCTTVFQVVLTILHFCQQCVRVLVALHPYQHFFIVSLNLSHSSGCAVILMLVLIAFP